MINMNTLFNDKYKDDILGTNNCFDRIVLKGSLTPISYVKGLSQFLSANNILLKDFTQYAKGLAETITENAKSIANKEGVPYYYINNSKFDKEKYIKSKITERGSHPGLVAVLAALEVDNGFDIFKNKDTHKLELVQRQRKCLHIYFYFIDEQFGLCYFRVQTYFPFKVQIYFNGREKLAIDMAKVNIAYQKDDNCFTWISDLPQAQTLADDLDVPFWHHLFDRWAEKYVPILKQLQKKWHMTYHWSVKQIEYATDIIFNSQLKLERLFTQLLQYAVLSALPEDIMSFLGKKLRGPLTGKIETSCKKSYLGYRIKHKAGSIWIKMYNKSGNVLRIEITFYNVSEFKVYRDVHQRDGQTVKKLANMTKSIYSLEHVVRIGKAAIHRYLDFLSKMEDNSTGLEELRQLTERKTENNRNYQGFNPLHREHSVVFQELINGAFIVNGFTNKSLKLALSQKLPTSWNTGKISRLIKRLRVFGLVRRVHKTYKYFPTEKGRMIAVLAVKLRNISVIPALNSLVNNPQTATA